MKHSQRNIGWNLSVVERYRFGFILGALLLLCALLSLSLPSSASALTTVPTKMNFQGRLTDSTGNIKPNGTYNMKLRLYTVNSGGTAVWTEDRLVSAGNGVTVTNGLFSIQLGSVTSLPASLFASGALYLEVELPTPATATTSGTPTWTEGAMTPRNQMATSAYAYNAETLDGKDSADFGQLVASNTWSGVNSFTDDVSISGELAVGSVVTSSLDIGGQAYIHADSTTVFSVASSTASVALAVDTVNSKVSVSTLHVKSTNSASSAVIVQQDQTITATGTSTYVQKIGAAGEDGGKEVITTSDGGYITSAKTDSYGAGQADVLVTKLSVAGAIQWSRVIGGASPDANYDNSIAQTTDGGYVVVFDSSSYAPAGNADAVAVKMNSAGVVQWARSIGGYNSDYFNSIFATSDGGFIAGGSYVNDGFNGGTMLAKYDSTGTLQWSKQYLGFVNIFQSVRSTSDGGYVATGSSSVSTSGGNDLVVSKFDSAGTPQWQYNFGGAGSEYGNEVKQTSDNGFIVVGTESSYGGTQGGFILRLNSSGALSWSKRLGGSGTTGLTGVHINGDGTYTIAGQTQSSGNGNSDIYIAKLASDGSSLTWQATWGGTQIDVGHSLAAGSDGGYAVLGASTSYSGNGYNDIIFAKFSGAGVIANCGAACKSAYLPLTSITPASTSAGTTEGTMPAKVTSSPVVTNSTVSPASSSLAMYNDGLFSTTATLDLINASLNGVTVGNVNQANAFNVQDASGTSLFNVDTVLGKSTFSSSLDVLGQLSVGSLTATNKVLFKNAANSTSAFEVQNSAAQTLFSVDTTNAGAVTILGNNSGEAAAWQTASNALPSGRSYATSVASNGYVYMIGGFNGTYQSTVYYAKLNADGGVGTWSTAANTLPALISDATSVVDNGYVYVMGGYNGTYLNSVYYAKLNADGSVGTWRTSPNVLPGLRNNATSVVANGYVYVLGGFDGNVRTNTVYYAKLNADGSVGTWSTAANALPAIRNNATSVIANGYVYVIGGRDNSVIQSTVYYAKLNADGSVGTWSTAANALPDTRSDATSVVSNGYVYVMGGTNGPSYSTVYYAKLNADGSVGTWSTAANALPATRYGATSIVSNGYAYVIGGVNAGNNSTVYYSRLGGVLSVGGSLDLVGLAGGSLADGGDASTGSVGGSLTAGNIIGVGTLQIEKQANFADSVSILGDFNAGNGIFSVENGNSVVRIGSSTADATGVVLVLDTKNTAGDPTGITGAMYYNSSLGRFRCYGATKWVDCRSSAASNTAISSVTNTVTETQFTGAYGVEANECVPGRMYRITARGTYSQAALATNLTMKIKWGTAILASTGAQAMGATAYTNQPWSLSADVVCQTSGTTGTVEAAGSFVKHTSAIASVQWAMANTAPVTVNTTTAANIAVTAQWSVANASNSITLRTLTINSLDNGN